MAGLPSLHDVVGKTKPGSVSTGELPSLSSLVGNQKLPSLNDLLSKKPTKAAPKSKGRGFFSEAAHIGGNLVSGLVSDAYNTPGSIVHLGEAVGQALPGKGQNTAPLKSIGHNFVDSTVESLTDPHYMAEHPDQTLLNAGSLFSLGAGSIERAGAAGKALDAGDAAGALKAIVKKPESGTRVIKIGKAEAKGHYSRAAGSKLVQKASDKALVKASDRSVKAENLLHRRAAKWNERTLRVQDAKARAPGTRLAALGAKLKPDELRAIRLVAEETPVERRLGAQQMRAARAKNAAEVARHQDRIALTKAAMEYLDEGPNGVPVFKPTATKLKGVYDALAKASTDREGMLKNVGLMDESAAAAAKTKVARVAAGATYGASRAPINIAKVKIGDRVHAPGVDGLAKVTYVDRAAGTVRVTAFDRGAKAWSEATYLHTDIDKPTKETIGANDIQASPKAVFIGNPVERGRISGAPRVSSTGTFGHTQKPGSLKTSTGGSVEHAMERNDVTNIVAERHSEAVRLSGLQRRVKLVEKAGKTEPQRNDDVFVWTDNKTVSSERIPPEVKRYLDNPEGMAKLPPGEQQSIMDKLKAATFERRDWNNPQDRAEFEKLAKSGKGVFVPRRLLGDAGKRSVNVEGIPGMGKVDAINNAQKAALIYLKVNYPLTQGISNAAMGLIHQGFAYPLNLTRAARLDRAVGPEIAAVIDDIMGQGAVMQAAFQGRSRLAHVTQKMAHVMSSAVDKPARRAAFLHEADLAGFGTPAKLKQLVEDDHNVDQLVDVAQRGKEAIVDYGDLGPTERNLVRRLVFVYPWQKGATKYAAYFFRDHPLQASAVGILGTQGKENADQTLGPVPSYMRGVFGVGGKLSNPSGINFFQTPAQLADTARGFASGDPAQPSLQDLLAPGPALAVALLTNRNDIGQQLKGNVGDKLRSSLVEPTPIAGLARQFGADRSTVVRDLFGGKTNSQTYPNKNDALWKFLLGGIYPRQYSKPALNKNAALEKSGR